VKAFQLPGKPRLAGLEGAHGPDNERVFRGDVEDPLVSFSHGLHSTSTAPQPAPLQNWGALRRPRHAFRTRGIEQVT
jgi:hypothetical protein